MASAIILIAFEGDFPKLCVDTISVFSVSVCWKTLAWDVC
uniref:Uncharacterized protein n=1 Tax=Anguilla anguilla TaxID=7936 RepID=A0A0E9U4U6_ANGAN